MSKERRVIGGFRDVYNKTIWLNKIEMEEALKEYKNTEVHYIEYIGKNKEPNVTKLAESFMMTRGAVSKITKKMIAKGVIESYQKPENKKEVYFRLTEKGRQVYDIHEALHEEFQLRDKPVFDCLSDADYHIIMKFVDGFNEHLDSELKKRGIVMNPWDYV